MHLKAAKLIKTMMEAMRLTKGMHSQFNTMPYIWLMKKSYGSQMKAIRMMQLEMANRSQEFKDKYNSIELVDPKYAEYAQ